jgi:hypothetical protein
VSEYDAWFWFAYQWNLIGAQVAGNVTAGR